MAKGPEINASMMRTPAIIGIPRHDQLCPADGREAPLKCAR
jgi:hypothetical protein